MRISKELLKQITVEEEKHGIVRLINVQTGDVEEDVVVGRRFDIRYKEHHIHLTISATHEGTPSITTRLSINFDTISIRELAAMFAVYKNLVNERQEEFKALSLDDLYRQRAERDVVRAEIIRQEKQYEKKLMMAEIKRLAKENVDSRRPPITAALPKPKMITTTEE